MMTLTNRTSLHSEINKAPAGTYVETIIQDLLEILFYLRWSIVAEKDGNICRGTLCISTSHVSSLSPQKLYTNN